MNPCDPQRDAERRRNGACAGSIPPGNRRASSVLPGLSSFLLLLLFGTIQAQDLPASTTPRGLVFAFLTETASTRDSIDRMRFRHRLSGELASVSPIAFKGLVPKGAEISIDSLFAIPSPEGLHKVVAYVSLRGSISADDQMSIFCRGDSIWSIEAVRQFPTASQRKIAASAIAVLDTSVPEQRLQREDLERILLPDDSLKSLFRPRMADADKIIVPLEKGKLWNDFPLRETDFTSLEEYRELDDDIADAKRIFYILDRPALERLKRSLGILRIAHDPLHPDLILLIAGGLRDDSYGYLHAPAPSLLPAIASDGYIAIHPIADHWWLYRKVTR